MKRHELNITIGPDGNIKIEVENVVGSDCKKITEDLENSLGKVVERELKPAYYKKDTNTNINIKS